MKVIFHWEKEIWTSTGNIICTNQWVRLLAFRSNYGWENGIDAFPHHDPHSSQACGAPDKSLHGGRDVTFNAARYSGLSIVEEAS